MKEFSEFVVAHWEALLSVCVALISLFIAIFRKRPSTDSLKTAILSYCGFNLATDIRIAESKYIDGAQKKLYVIEQAIKYIGKNFVLDDKATSKVRDTISTLVEAFLSTPEKKV